MGRHGRCWTTSDHQHHRPCRRSLARLVRGREMNHVPLSASGTIHEGLGSVAEASSRSSWPTLALHPRGGHCWLSASVSAPLTVLEKIEKLPVRGTLGAMTSFKSLGSFTWPIAIHPRPIRSRTMHWAFEEATSIP